MKLSESELRSVIRKLVSESIFGEKGTETERDESDVLQQYRGLRRSRKDITTIDPLVVTTIRTSTLNEKDSFKLLHDLTLQEDAVARSLDGHKISECKYIQQRTSMTTDMATMENFYTLLENRCKKQNVWPGNLQYVFNGQDNKSHENPPGGISNFKLSPPLSDTTWCNSTLNNIAMKCVLETVNDPLAGYNFIAEASEISFALDDNRYEVGLCAFLAKAWPDVSVTHTSQERGVDAQAGEYKFEVKKSTKDKPNRLYNMSPVLNDNKKFYFFVTSSQSYLIRADILAIFERSQGPMTPTDDYQAGGMKDVGDLSSTAQSYLAADMDDSDILALVANKNILGVYDSITKDENLSAAYNELAKSGGGFEIDTLTKMPELLNTNATLISIASTIYAMQTFFNTPATMVDVVRRYGDVLTKPAEIDSLNNRVQISNVAAQAIKSQIVPGGLEVAINGRKPTQDDLYGNLRDLDPTAGNVFRVLKNLKDLGWNYQDLERNADIKNLKPNGNVFYGLLSTSTKFGEGKFKIGGSTARIKVSDLKGYSDVDYVKAITGTSSITISDIDKVMILKYLMREQGRAGTLYDRLKKTQKDKIKNAVIAKIKDEMKQLKSTPTPKGSYLIGGPNPSDPHLFPFIRLAQQATVYAKNRKNSNVSRDFRKYLNDWIQGDPQLLDDLKKTYRARTKRATDADILLSMPGEETEAQMPPPSYDALRALYGEDPLIKEGAIRAIISELILAKYG